MRVLALLCDKAQINPPIRSTVARDIIKDIIASSASVGGSPVEAWVSSGSQRVTGNISPFCSDILLNNVYFL